MESKPINPDGGPGIDWLQFFSGGVPSLEYFRFQVSDIRALANRSKVRSGLDTTAELCMIGLAAYFEAFCKNEFAAVINIFPEVLSGLAEKRECRITARNLLHVISEFDHSLGFLIAEEFDFGSAKSINCLFRDLLNISPFSKAEASKYSEFLRDRNLLVHHGGIYTAKYRAQVPFVRQTPVQIYFDSLVVNKSDVYKWADFLIELATKMGSATAKALSQLVTSKGLKCDTGRKKAIDALADISLSAPSSNKRRKANSTRPRE